MHWVEKGSGVFYSEFLVNVHNKRANIRKQFVKCAFNVPRNGLTSNEKLSTDYFSKVGKHRIDPITMQSNTIQDVNDSICRNTVRESANVIWQWFEVSSQCVAFVRKIVESRPRLHVFLCWFHFDSSLNSFRSYIFLFLFYLTIETKKMPYKNTTKFWPISFSSFKLATSENHTHCITKSSWDRTSLKINKSRVLYSAAVRFANAGNANKRAANE